MAQALPLGKVRAAGIPAGEKPRGRRSLARWAVTSPRSPRGTVRVMVSKTVQPLTGGLPMEQNPPECWDGDVPRGSEGTPAALGQPKTTFGP